MKRICHKNISEIFMAIVVILLCYIFSLKNINVILKIFISLNIIFYINEITKIIIFEKGKVFISIILLWGVVFYSLKETNYFHLSTIYLIVNSLFFLIFYIKNIFFSNKLETFVKIKENNDEQDYLFSYRKNEIMKLGELCSNKNLPTIVIDQKIGSGKTKVIEFFLKKEINKEIIYLKLPLVEGYEEFKEIIFSEMSIIFRKNGINYSNLKNIFKYISGVKAPNIEIDLHRKNTTLWDELKELKRKILYLNSKGKQLLIVIDDIERVQDIELIEKSICLLGELAEFFRGTETTVLFLVDREKIKEMIDKNKNKHNSYFIDKYMSYNFKISSPIVENISEQDLNYLINEALGDKGYSKRDLANHKNSINEVFEIIRKMDRLIFSKEISELRNNYENIAIFEEYKEFIEIIEKTKEQFKINNNLRNIKKFINQTEEIIGKNDYKSINEKMIIALYFIEIFFPIYYSYLLDRSYLNMRRDFKKFKNIMQIDIFDFLIRSIIEKELYYDSYEKNPLPNENKGYEKVLTEKIEKLLNWYKKKNYLKDEYLIGYDKVILDILSIRKMDESEKNEIRMEDLDYNKIFAQYVNDLKTLESFFSKSYIPKNFLNQNNISIINKIIEESEVKLEESKDFFINIIRKIYLYSKNYYFFQLYELNNPIYQISDDFEEINENKEQEKEKVIQLNKLKDNLLKIKKAGLSLPEMNDIFLVIEEHLIYPWKNAEIEENSYENIYEEYENG